MTDPRTAVAAVVDPEIRVITIDELGILRAVDEDPATGRVVDTITPTFTGCPAMDVIRTDIRRALTVAGHPDAEVRTVYTPAWSTDWISAAGRAKLAAAG
ncbi:iron-sulfur cluster assembly protein, partial [Streptomyces sp. NPDC052644]